MEYVQMTLNEWVEIKQKLRKELLGIKQSFVRIGYMLRQIDDLKSYERDGYKSIAEFGQKELGLHPSTTKRFMDINREYSIDGFSERLRPEFAELGRSQLEEMLKLPDSDRQMIQPETPRESIRELKRFNNAGPTAGADDFTELLIKFYKDNPDALNEVFTSVSTSMDPEYINRVKEVINPSGNRSYKMGLYFLMFYENKISIKQFGSNPQNMMWEEFIQKTRDIFGDVAAGPETWKNYFGGEADEDTGSGTTAEDGTENECSPETRSVENHGGTDRNREEETENDGQREENIQKSDERVKTREVTERIGEKTTGEEIAPAQKSAPDLVNTESEADSEQVEGQTELTRDFPQYCPDPVAEKTDPAEEKPAYGNRKQFLDEKTAYGAALYMAASMRTMPHMKLTEVDFWEKWLSEEVDERGERIEVVE